MFNKFRIPRENLLSRYIYVDKEGNFEIRGDLRALYFGMVRTRIAVTSSCVSSIGTSALFSVRYAVCRRQFKTIKGSNQERKLIDYQTHMAVLGPHVAAKFVISFVVSTLVKIIDDTTQLIKEKESYEMLDILHHLTSGYKAYMTEYAYKALDEMRQACGGAGYHIASGVALN